MLTIRTINSPSAGILKILAKKAADTRLQEAAKEGSVNALGLVQGQLADIYMAGDIAEKAASVKIAEVAGMCPQHMSMICVFGDVAEVAEALKAVRAWSFEEDLSV
jgi:ethanolamine utilization microcompartment shell protein EutS